MSYKVFTQVVIEIYNEGKFTGGGSDANKAGHHPLHGSDDGALEVYGHVERQPHEDARGGADVGVQHRQRSDFARCERRSAVEAGPTHPQKPSATKHVYNVVMREMLPVLPMPWPHLSINITNTNQLYMTIHTFSPL